jgi:CubicO group peptidase (beta-lactamase class C family)
MNKCSPQFPVTSWLLSATLVTALGILPTAPALAEPLIDRLGLETMAAAIDRGDYRRIEAVIVERGGETLFEDYYRMVYPEMRIDARSVGKSITALAVGMAIEDGALAGVDVPLLDFFPDLAPFAYDGGAKRAITLADLLTMSSALDCDDSSQDSPGHEGRMYNSAIWTRFALDIPIDPNYARNPDTGRGRFSYCTAGVFLLGRVVERAVGEPFEAYVQRRLFDPLGITFPTWLRAPEGVVQSGGQLRLRSRDFTALGRLVLDGGRFNGETIVSSGWLQQMLQPRTRAVPTVYEYGYLWWIGDFRIDDSPALHRGFAMRGNGGNKIVLFPDLDAVITLLATNYNEPDMHDLTYALLSQYILPALAANSAESFPHVLGGVRYEGPELAAASDSRFSLGMTTDGQTFVDSAMLYDTVMIRGEIQPEAADVGRSADVFVVDRLVENNSWWMQTASGAWVSWNGVVADLQPFRKDQVLTAALNLDLFSGTVGNAGNHRIFLGYRTPDGVLRYHVNGLPVTIFDNVAGGL